MNLWILDESGQKQHMDKPPKKNTRIYGVCQVCGREFSRIYYNKKNFVEICSDCLRKKTSIEKYGTSDPMHRARTAFQKQYGVKSPTQLEKFKQKIKEVVRKRYGVDNVAQSEEIKNKIKQTNLKRYGVSSVLKLDEVRKLSEIKHHGVGFSSPEVRQKIEQKMIEKFGVANPSMAPELHQKKMRSLFARYYKQITTRLKGYVEPLFSVEDYIGNDKYYKWRCLKCGTVFEDKVDDGRIPRCPVCFPPLGSRSYYEDEIADFLNQFNVVKNKKIGKYEIDIYLPNYKLGIEFDGLYWHSEIGGKKNKTYHLDKTEYFAKHGIQIIHIFEDEWIEKQDIVKSIILNKLGKTENVLYARKLNVVEIETQQARDFLEYNHLQGYKGGRYKLALIDGNELYAVLIVGASRYNKLADYEIIRFAFRRNHIVVGGFKKLLAQVPTPLISYVDRRYFSGYSYEKAGFRYLHDSKPNYFYTDYKHRYSRIQFQKHKLNEKLENFDPNLTEWQNMQFNGWDRIWDCGNKVYVK